MVNIIQIRQVDLRIQDSSLESEHVIMPQTGGKDICDFLEVVTLNESFLKVKSKIDGRKFRAIFSIDGNVSTISPTYTSKAGDEYNITAREGYDIGVECI